MTKNAKGCISQAAYAYVNTPPTVPAAPTVTVKQPSACGVTDGSITINTTAMSYSFNDGASWSTINTKSNLGAGTYIIKVKLNSYSCESLTTIVNLAFSNHIMIINPIRETKILMILITPSEKNLFIFSTFEEILISISPILF